MTAADDREVTTGPCGDRAPLYGDGPPLFCDLRSGHAGWHEGGEHRTSWTYHAQPTRDALAAAEARGVERGYRRAAKAVRAEAAERRRLASDALDRQSDGDTEAERHKVRFLAQAVALEQIAERLDQDADSARHSTPQTAQPRVWVLPSIPEDVKAVRDGKDPGVVWRRYGLRRDWWVATTDDTDVLFVEHVRGLENRTGAMLIQGRGPLTEVPDA